MAVPEPEPSVILPSPKLPRAKKSSVQESLDLLDDFEVTGMTKKHYCRQTGVKRNRLNAAFATRKRLYETYGVDFDKLSPKERQSRSLGSGKKKPEDYVITPLMSDHLLDYMKRYRGPPPKKHHLYSHEDQYLYQDGIRIAVTYNDLIEQISLVLDETEQTEVFDAVPEDIWFQRVRLWCHDKRISRRRFNKKSRSAKDEVITANRCKGTLREFERVHTTGDSVAGMDETSMRILAMDVESLHWTGDDEVPISEEASSKLTLSTVVSNLS